jgi:hypothetical protein
MKSSLLTEERGRKFCRACNSTELFSALDLGALPIANELLQDGGREVQVFPLHLRICEECGLGQVQEVVTPVRLFQDYRYLSSISDSFVSHAKEFAKKVTQDFGLTSNDLVLEIASNDGYLLQHFVKLGIGVIGIEPAENVAALAKSLGIPTINEFFGLELARNLRQTHNEPPRLIIANNVMAHVPDIQDFIQGIAELAGQSTIISIENPSLMNLVSNGQFDTIYHEHYSYLTAHSVAALSEKYGLELFDVEQITTHGGSIRYWLRKKNSINSINPRVSELKSNEIANGLFDALAWKKFAKSVETTLVNFYDWLASANVEGRNVYGYGAAAKASTLINAAKIENGWIKGIADGSFEKQGRFMPTASIKVISPSELFEMSPTDVIVFPWNISDEIVKIVTQGCSNSVRIWRVIPDLKQIF